jgi:hypothetical protein
MAEKRNMHIGFWWASQKTPLGRPGHRWDNNIKMDLRETRWGGMDWIDLPENKDQWRALVNMVMNLQVP